MKNRKMFKNLMVLGVVAVTVSNTNVPTFAEVGISSVSILEEVSTPEVLEGVVVEYTYEGEDRIFDGTRSIDYTEQDLQTIKDAHLEEGTIIITSRMEPGVAEHDKVYTAIGFGAESAPESSKNKIAQLVGANYTYTGKMMPRYEMGGGANSTAASNIDYNDGEWHVIALSYANGEIFVSGDGVTGFTQFDGNQKNPAFDGFLTKNEDMNSITVGSVEGVTINNQGSREEYAKWIGEIAQITILDRPLSVEEANKVTAERLEEVKKAQVSQPQIVLEETEAGTWVTMATDTEDADIYYTLDGLTPTVDSPRYEEPICLTESTTVSAIAIKEGMTSSEVAVQIVEVKEKVETPVLVVGEQTTDVREVEIISHTEGATIYYTLDGTEPTVESLVYEGPIVLLETTEIKAMAIKEGMRSSDILTEVVEVKEVEEDKDQVYQTVVNIEYNRNRTQAVVTLSSWYEGATNWYSIDGGEAVAYTAPITLTEKVDMTVWSTKEGALDSVARTFTVDIVE